MSTPHRGLPPPAAMTSTISLPEPPRGPPPMPSSSLPQMQLPAPPSQWQGAEEAMRNWLMAKAEEDKKRQEEEKTRQESLRLEQRKIEQSMLRESMQGGVPPHMVPMIFAGIGGANLANVSLDWLQQYATQLQAAQQQQLAAQTSGVFTSAPQSGAPSAAVFQAQPLPGQPQAASPFPAYPSATMSPQSRAKQSTAPAFGPTSAPRPPPQSALPKLTTNEMQQQQAPAPSTHAIHSAQPSEQTSSSPSIYFHHWVPPTSQSGSGGNHPATPSDYTSSPKKRKAQGSHQPAPIPTSAPSYTSPSYSHFSSAASTPARRAHARTRSDASTSARGYETPGQQESRPPTGGTAGTTEGGHIPHTPITEIRGRGDDNGSRSTGQLRREPPRYYSEQQQRSAPPSPKREPSSYS